MEDIKTYQKSNKKEGYANTGRSLNEVAKEIEDHNFEWSWYCEYPPIPAWKKEVDGEIHKKSLESLAEKHDDHQLSLYFHFPYCKKKCLYCVCFNEITRDNDKVEEFLKYQVKEIDMVKKIFDSKGYSPNFQMIHLGGGSPSMMTTEQLEGLIQKINSLTDVKRLKEIAIEIDPRTVDLEKLEEYSQLGISRISLGVQDFDPNVQKAINRVQPLDMIQGLVEKRGLFKSLNFDILYGLPYQTIESFRKTTETVIKLSPDRISTALMYYNPSLIKHQKAMDETKIPSFHDKTIMFLEICEALQDSGYLKIGIDHFSKPSEELGKAFMNKNLGRSSLGYTYASEDILGLGAWSMSRINNVYSQNTSSLKEYYGSISNEKFATFRGYVLNQDELLRREIIKDIICYSKVDFKDIENKFSINFKEYFKKELENLSAPIKEGMVIFNDDSLNLTNFGNFFQRNICAYFDTFYQNKNMEYQHSRKI